VIDADALAEMRGLWQKAGDALLGPDGPVARGALPGADRADAARLGYALDRLAATLTAGGIALCMPLDEHAAPHAVAAAMRLCHEGGLRGFSARGQSPAATREMLLEAALSAGCDRALFLGHDSLVDRQGLWQLMSTMDATGAAAVAAITVVPVPPPQPPTALSAFVGREGSVRRMTKDDLTVSGVPFPVHHLDGIVALLLDLSKIRRYQGPRFSSRTEGTVHVSEDEAFAKWLDMHSLDLLVDPKAQAARVAQQLYGFRWEPPKEDA
jgi:hypothetical protein